MGLVRNPGAPQLHPAAAKTVAAAIACLAHLCGCTSPATKLAIGDYVTAERQKQSAFDVIDRIAKEQLNLNLQQRIAADPAHAAESALAVMKAREAIETARVQYLMGRAFTASTVGQYLYDQQGPLNVIFEKAAKQGDEFTGAVDAGNKAAGMSGPGDLVAAFKGVPATQPAFQSPVPNPLHASLNDILGMFNQK